MGMNWKYGYVTIVSLESVENATVLAALTFIDMSGALIGAIISIAAYIILAVNSLQVASLCPYAFAVRMGAFWSMEYQRR